VKTRLLLVVAVGLALVAADKPDSKKEDKDLILGNWSFASGERNGEQPPDEIQSMKLTFKEDKLTALIRDETKEGKYKLDPAKKPKEIKVTITENGNEKELHGIYELDGDNLKLCFPSEDGGDLPKEFTGKQGSNQMLMVFKRAK
jgi:uncharacterized protein (TIGR03067 family)